MEILFSRINFAKKRTTLFQLTIIHNAAITALIILQLVLIPGILHRLFFRPR